MLMYKKDTWSSLGDVCIGTADRVSDRKNADVWGVWKIVVKGRLSYKIRLKNKGGR